MANQILFGSFKRLRNFPLDPSELFLTKAELDNYIKSNPIAYNGQKVVVCDDGENNGLYIIVKENNILTLLRIPDIHITEKLASDLLELKNNYLTLEASLNESISDFVNKIDSAEKLINQCSKKLEDKADTTEIARIEGIIAEIQTNMGSGYEELKKYVDDTYYDINELKSLFSEYSLDGTTIKKLIQDVDTISKWMNSHKTEFDNLIQNSPFVQKELVEKISINTSDIGNLSNKIDGLTNTVERIYATKTALELVDKKVEDNKEEIARIADEYLTKTAFQKELDAVKSQIKDVVEFENVEQIVQFDFRQNGINKIENIFHECRITEINVQLDTFSVSDVLPSIKVFDGSKTDTLISSDELYFCNDGDNERYFNFILNKYIPGEINSIYIECENFDSATGTIFVKYFHVK